MERAIRYASDILQLESFHPLQIRCLKAVYERKDVVVMKTGSGKSAIYQAARTCVESEPTVQTS